MARAVGRLDPAVTDAATEVEVALARAQLAHKRRGLHLDRRDEARAAARALGRCPRSRWRNDARRGAIVVGAVTLHEFGWA